MQRKDLSIVVSGLPLYCSVFCGIRTFLALISILANQTMLMLQLANFFSRFLIKMLSIKVFMMSSIQRFSSTSGIVQRIGSSNTSRPSQIQQKISAFLERYPTIQDVTLKTPDERTFLQMLRGNPSLKDLYYLSSVWMDNFLEQTDSVQPDIVAFAQTLMQDAQQFLKK